MNGPCLCGDTECWKCYPSGHGSRDSEMEEAETMNVEIIRTDGTEEKHTSDWDGVRKLIGAEYLDTVNLRDGRVMLVDDLGYETRLEERPDGPNGEVVFESVAVRARKPVNEKATKLYHALCVPGTTHQIVGDVAIVVDAEVA